MERNQTELYPSRRSFLKKAVSALGSLALAGWIGAGIGCGHSGNGTEPERIGNLRGVVTGLLTDRIISSGTVSLPGTDYSAAIRNDGSFEILNIHDPSNYRRIRLTSPQAITRETNITINAGDNNAEINMIEADNISGYKYQDYLTVNYSGWKMDVSQNYQTYFYDRSIWEVNYDEDVATRVGTISEAAVAAKRAQIIDVLQNDLPVMSKNNYRYNLLLESEGAEGPGIPIATQPKRGWLIIYIRKNQGAGFYTFKSINNYIVTGGIMSINYSDPLGTGRGAFSQDTCEWAGYIDYLKKSNYSIFGDDDSGYRGLDYPSSFDRNYISVIKYNRLPGHYSNLDVPDYEPSGSGNGSGVLVTHSLGVMPVMPDNSSPYDSDFPSLLDPFSEQRRDRMDWDREYNRWLKEQDREGKKEERK